MTVIDFADSSLGEYFAARDHLVAVGLRHGYNLDPDDDQDDDSNA